MTPTIIPVLAGLLLPALAFGPAASQASSTAYEIRGELRVHLADGWCRSPGLLLAESTSGGALRLRLERGEGFVEGAVGGGRFGLAAGAWDDECLRLAPLDALVVDVVELSCAGDGTAFVWAWFEGQDGEAPTRFAFSGWGRCAAA